MTSLIPPMAEWELAPPAAPPSTVDPVEEGERDTSPKEQQQDEKEEGADPGGTTTGVEEDAVVVNDSEGLLTIDTDASPELTLPELRQRLKALGLSTSGKKSALLHRYHEHQKSVAEEEEAP